MQSLSKKILHQMKLASVLSAGHCHVTDAGFNCATEKAKVTCQKQTLNHVDRKNSADLYQLASLLHLHYFKMSEYKFEKNMCTVSLI